MAEVWGYRLDGTNSCRHVPMFPVSRATRLINDEEMGKLFSRLDQMEAEGIEPSVIPLAIRLQFEFAARRSEIVLLEWKWVDLEHWRVVWPDSKTGGMSKPMSEEAYRLLSTAPRQEGSLYVLPSPKNPLTHLIAGEYYGGWSRALKTAGVPHVGTHGIRHRSATDIANSGIPVKVGMVLTAHKTVAMFMRYVHTEDAPVGQAAELVANRRKTVVDKQAGKQACPVRCVTCLLFVLAENDHVSDRALPGRWRAQGSVHRLAEVASRQSGESSCSSARDPDRVGQLRGSQVLSRWRMGTVHRRGARLSGVLRLVGEPAWCCRCAARQAQCGHCTGGGILAGLATESGR